MPSSETNALILGTYWTTIGQPASLTYTVTNGSNRGTVNSQFVSAVDQAVDAWNSVANINLSFVASSQPADITIFPGRLTGDTVGLTQYAISGNRYQSGVTITMDNQFFQPEDFLPDTETLGFQVLMHELGHALGLAHPDDGSSLTHATISGNGASMDGTIMGTVAGDYGTYTWVGGVPITPMIYDIAAMQYLYGANYDYNAEDTLYLFDGTQTSMTIWDGGGTDTLDCSAMIMAVTIDLREGLSNVTRAGESRVWNAFGANMENATGGSGGDTIYGSALNNVLLGNAGNDTISASTGDDTINGNSGEDTVSGEAGNDSVRGGKENDTVNGNAGDDLVFGDRENDYVRGGEGNDVLHGGKAGDTVQGEAGADTLMGELGDDTLTGGTGNDVFVFGMDSGVDVITDFAAGDVLQVDSSIFSSAAIAVLAASISGGNALIDLGDGNSVQLTGVSSLLASDFVIA